MNKDLLIFLLVLLLTGSILYAIIITIAYYLAIRSKLFWFDMAKLLSIKLEEKEKESKDVL